MAKNAREGPDRDRDRDQDRQSGRRGEIIPGQGYDAGRGYGGAGSDNLYDGDQNFGRGRDASSEESVSPDADIDRETPLGGERREPGR